MKVRKDRLTLLIVALSVMSVASFGLYWWYTIVLANLFNIASLSSLPLIVGFAFVAGVASFFSPCGLASQGYLKRTYSG